MSPVDTVDRARAFRQRASESPRATVLHRHRAAAERLGRDELELPRARQPALVQLRVGPTASRGARYGTPLGGAATLYLSRDGQVSFDAPIGEVWNAVSGLGYVLESGARAKLVEDAFTRAPYPRTIAATDASAPTLLLLVVDGKQPGYGEGVTLAEAAELLLELGAFTAIQLDGGGSSTLVRSDTDGGARVVSSPANFKVPGWERSIGTGLGIKAMRLPHSTTPRLR